MNHNQSIILDPEQAELEKIPEQYRQRFGRHWTYRRDLANHLLLEYALPRFKDKAPKDTVVLDLGCSIGNFTAAFARQGFQTYGIDLDQDALDLAGKLAYEKLVHPTFIQADVATLEIDVPPIDLAFCFDVIEHLHDDQLGTMLYQLRRKLNMRGCLVFHSWPTEYDHVFHNKSFLRYPLIPFAWLSAKHFNVITKIYANLVEITLLLRKGVTYREKNSNLSHCNPLSKERLRGIFTRAGYEMLILKAENLYPLEKSSLKFFAKQPIAFSNLYGVAVPK